MRALAIGLLGALVTGPEIGCVAEAYPPVSSGGNASVGSGSTITTDNTLAQCQAIVPDEGDLCYPTDSPYTLVARAASTWSYRYPGIGFDVTPPPSASWSWYNQGTSAIATVGGMERLTLPAEVFAGNGFRGRVRARPSDPTVTPYYVDFCVASPWVAGGTSGQGANAAAHTDGTGLHVLYGGGGYLAQQIFSNATTFVSGSSAEATAPLVLCGRLAEDGTNRSHFITSPADGTRTLFGAASSRTGTFTGDQVGFFGNMADADSARTAFLVHWATGAL